MIYFFYNVAKGENDVEYAKKVIFRHRYAFLLLLCINCMFFWSMGSLLKGMTKPYGVMFLLGAETLMLFVTLFAAKGKRLSDRQMVFLIIGIGFLLRLAYILVTEGGYSSGKYFIERQHDVHYFGGPEEYVTGTYNGHAAYIEYYFFGNGIPDFDPRKIWQFYHPPLWHMICALWLRVQTVLGIAYQTAVENLQLLSLFCSSAIMVASHRTFSLFGLKGTPLRIAVSLVAFHPTFVMLSGSINNDVLSLFLMLLSVNLAIKWYKQPKMGNIVPLAFSIGLAMMAKLSGGLVAVAVAVLFFAKMCDKKVELKGLFAQFGVFGIICVPIALWHQVRNFLLFKVPLTYVPGLSEKADQYVGFRTVGERIFDISSIFEQGIYPARATEYLTGKYGFLYFDHNLPVNILKSSVFGEYYFGAGDKYLEPVARLLFWTAAILAMLSLAATVWFCGKMIFSKIKGIDFEKENGFGYIFGIFMLIFYGTMMFSYTSFAFKFPHYCSMDFRYIALTVVVGALYIGLLHKNITKNNNMAGKVFSYALIALTVCFGASSSLLLAFAG